MIKAAQKIYSYFDGRYPSHMKILRYLVSGGSGVILNLACLYLFADVFGIWYLAAAVIAFCVAAIGSFIMQKYWTFRHNGREAIPAQAVKYLILAAINLALNTALIYAFVEGLGFHHLVAQIFASAIIAVESFFVYKVIFR